MNSKFFSRYKRFPHLHHLHSPRDLLVAKFTARKKKPRARALRAMSRSSRKMPGRVSFGPTGHFQHFRISFLLLKGDFLMGFPVPWHNWHLGGETEGQGGWWWFFTDSNVLLDGVLYPKWHLQLGSGTLFSHKAK